MGVRRKAVKTSAKPKKVISNHDSAESKDPKEKLPEVSSRKRVSESSEKQIAKRLKIAPIQEGILLTLGQGDTGQLGLGDEILSRKKPAIVKEIEDIPITLVSTGGMHTVCLSHDNKVYTFGCNDEFALGRDTDDDDEYFPKPTSGNVFVNNKVVMLTAGDSHSAALTEDGSVYIWGCFRNIHGKIGLIQKKESCKYPTLIDSVPEPIKAIASGNDHFVMLSEAGNVYTIGDNIQGQLGRFSRYFIDESISGRSKRKDVEEGENLEETSCSVNNNQESPLIPGKVPIPRKKGGSTRIQKIFCGAFCTWLISESGYVFSFGLNNYRQIGLEGEDNVFRPQYVETMAGEKWMQIAGGEHHTLLLNTEGSVFVLGRGEYGRLGLGEDINQVNEPQKIPSLTEITSVSTGSCVSFAVAKNGDAFGWGLGTNFQLTTTTEDDVWTPAKLTGKNLESRKVLRVASGGQHTVIVARDNDDDEE